MKTNDKTSIPEDIATCLNGLARDLWSGRAAVMIGAGFSRNARKVGTSAPDFPNWHELGDHLYEEIHGGKPDDKEHHYLNPLALADEVQAARDLPRPMPIGICFRRGRGSGVTAPPAGLPGPADGLVNPFSVPSRTRLPEFHNA